MNATFRHKPLLAAALVDVLALLCATHALAQSEESELPPAPGDFEPALAAPPK